MTCIKKVENCFTIFGELKQCKNLNLLITSFLTVYSVGIEKGHMRLKRLPLKLSFWCSVQAFWNHFEFSPSFFGLRTSYGQFLRHSELSEYWYHHDTYKYAVIYAIYTEFVTWKLLNICKKITFNKTLKNVKVIFINVKVIFNIFKKSIYIYCTAIVKASNKRLKEGQTSDLENAVDSKHIHTSTFASWVALKTI